MLGTLTLLLLCQLTGELAARLLHLPIPGPVLGMLLLFAGPRPVGTFLVVASVLGVVGVSVTGREDE